MGQKTYTNTRASERRKVRWPAIVSSAAGSESDFSEAVTIENVSTGGAFFYFKSALKKDHRLEININLGHMVTKVVAYVVHTVDGDDGYGVGVRFESLFEC